MRTILRGIGGAALLGLCGCTWSHSLSTGAAHPPGPSTATSVTPGAAKPGWQGPQPVPQMAPMPNSIQQASHPAAVNEQASLLVQRLAALDDDRKIFAARVQQLESQLREKDKALVQASFEIQEATGQIAKTREDLRRWKLEMESLRGKLRNVEHDNKTTLEAIIRTLEQFLDRERGFDRERDGHRSTEIAPLPIIN